MSQGQKMPALEDAPPALAVAEEREGGKKEEDPAWLKVLMRTRFWQRCKEHSGMNRADGCKFCIHCYEVICPHCSHDDEPSHQLLKIRRYLFRSTVLATDMEDLGINVKNIQPFSLNSQKVLHLRPMKRSRLFRPPAGTPRCQTCQCYLQYNDYLYLEKENDTGWISIYEYCSVVCQKKGGIPPDDFSGSEAEERLRSLHNKEQRLVDTQGNEPEAIDNAPELAIDNAPEPAIDNLPGPSNAPPVADQGRVENNSFRRKKRKQAMPKRAPFF